MLDCEQSIFFFRFQGGVHAPVSVSRAFCSTDQEKRETARIVFLQFIYLGHIFWHAVDCCVVRIQEAVDIKFS